MNRLLATLLLLFAVGSAHAHQDTILKLSADGALAGLPTTYQPSAVHLRFLNIDGERRLSEIVLSIAQRKVTVPQCVAGLINTTQQSGVFVSGSWYHERSRLPPYLNIVFLDPGSDTKPWPNSGFSLLFNLETSKLIRMEVMIAKPELKSMQSIPVDLTQRCSQAELRRFYAPLSSSP